MARRRRFRRNRHRAHQQHSRPNVQKDAPINNSVMNTPITRNARPILTPIQNLDTQKHFENPKPVLTPIQNFDGKRNADSNRKAFTPIQNFDVQKNVENLSETPRILRSNSVVLRKNMNEVQTVRSRSNSFATPKNINFANLNAIQDENKTRKKMNSDLRFDEKDNLKRMNSNYYYEELKSDNNYLSDEMKLKLLAEELKFNTDYISEQQHKINSNLISEEHRLNTNLISEQRRLNSNLISEQHRLNSNLMSEELRLNSNLISEELRLNPNLISEERRLNPNLISEELRLNPNLISEELRSNQNLISEELRLNPNLLSEELRLKLCTADRKSFPVEANVNRFSEQKKVDLPKQQVGRSKNLSSQTFSVVIQNSPQTSPFIGTTQTTPIMKNVRNKIQPTSINRYFQNKSPASVAIKNRQTSLIARTLENNTRASSIPRNYPTESSLSKDFPLKPKNNTATIKVDVATQTAHFNHSGNKNCMLENNLNQTKYDIHNFAQIFETPKIRCNFSPSEYTEFAPQFHASSTPLNGCIKENKLLAGSHKDRGVKTCFCRDCTTNPKPVPKILDKNKMYSINKHRFYKSMSPKIFRSTYVKLYNKHQSPPGVKHSTNFSNKPAPEIPKSFSPVKKSVLRNSDNFLNTLSVGVHTKIMARVRSFHRRHSSKWLEKLCEIYGNLGMAIRTGLATIYKPKATELLITAEITENHERAICDCKKLYEEELGKLEEKLRDMRANCDKEVEEVKKEMSNLRAELVQMDNDKKVEAMKREMLNFRAELMEEMDKKINEIKSSVEQKARLPPPPPPPPMMGLILPPPPPPPMPVNATTPLSRNVKLTKVQRESKKESENTRPVISLDDILKVRLKKPGDRQQINGPKLQRHNTQPLISSDMLKQVKLRPASRKNTPLSASLAEESNSKSLSTSPASSLTRILSKVDYNVHKVKRLKRTGVHSSDDIYRRVREFKREW